MPNVGEVLGSLDPDFRTKVIDLIDACKDEHGFRIVPYDGARSPWQQAIYWRQSRTSTQVQQAIARMRSVGADYIAHILEDVGPQSGKHVTDALPGQSFHQFRRAFDCYIESPNSKHALWREKGKDGDEFALAKTLYDRLGETSEAMGLTWGGRWEIGDFGHVQSQKASSPLQEYGSWPALDDALRQAWPHP